jgi:putative zinc finger/helix-turn-helix YgiT family protein
MEHDGKSYPVEVKDLSVLKCQSCGALVVPDESMTRVYREFRIVVGLLLPSEIRNGRDALGLTQEKLARDLGIASETISRWETGKQIQQLHLDRMLRAFFRVPEFRRFLANPLGATEQPEKTMTSAFVIFDPVNVDQPTYTLTGASSIAIQPAMPQVTRFPGPESSDILLVAANGGL